MPKFKKFVIFGFVLFAVILVNVFYSKLSSSHGSGYGSSHYVRQELEPVETAEEWMRRLKLDVENNYYDVMPNLYAELPPKNEWTNVIKSLDELAGDVGQIKKMMGNNSYGNQPEIMAQKFSIFSKLLKNGDADVEPELRKLILYANRDGGNEFTALLMASKDKQATQEWIMKNQSKSKSTHSSSSYVGSSDSDKSDWEIAFAENKVDEGISLLKKEISMTSERPDIASHWERLIRIGLLTDRIPLAIEATENLRKNLISHVQIDQYFTPYYYNSLFDLNLKNQEWQTILDTLDQVYVEQSKKKNPSSSGSYGYLDEANALHLTALYRLGKTDEFMDGIEAAQEVTQNDPEEFFRMLTYAATGQPPLGVLYLEHLNKAADPENAKVYALHLLARNQGMDVYYENLINLDQTLARSFIQSLRVYDPYEERPLIWQAELARRNGDLDLALKTIEQAIALDPSDGDHGKDSRMFCYEVLARVHADAGRKDKADFFRSVVDSIRQGEAADDFLHAGLIKEAAERYQKALGKFEDAYCLQSRLAMTLARNGQFDESVKHFKKAFELMPVSFGPRESHCFGCEGLFSDPRVIEIAKPLLMEFEKNNPKNPRAPYLLGLVLKQSKEEDQAAIAFQRAFEIDDNYYNAAIAWLEILEKDPYKYGEVEALRKRIYLIAPYASKPDYFNNQTNLHEYWDLIENFPPPLSLPVIPFLKSQEEPKINDQFLPYEASRHRHFGNRESEAIKGWTKSHLRRSNEFLRQLDYIR